MIRKITRDDLPACAALIRESFMTVANEFGITPENAPRFTAFAVDEARLRHHMDVERRPMYGWFEGDRPVGYYSLLVKADGACELNNLCVLPECRHGQIGRALLRHAFERARALGCARIDIGIVEENRRLRRWYEAAGFVHTGTRKFDFFPFTCGYMEKTLG